MTKIALVLASAATLALAAGAVHAQRPERGNEMTRAEVEQRTVQAFERMDANHDGVLNAADRDARQAGRGERRAERREARFERLDADHDGAISRAEFDAAHDQARERFAERREGGERFGHRGPGKHRFGGMQGAFGPGAFGADGDGDKAVTQAEFTAAALERFDRADANSDGTVTATERREMRKAFREQRRAAHTNDQS